MLYRIYLEQNKELLIENKLKKNSSFYFEKKTFFLKTFLPCVHKRPVKPSEQLHIKDGYGFPNAH
jgi:hypothetical protein